jgi:hypothetical protein
LLFGKRKTGDNNVCDLILESVMQGKQIYIYKSIIKIKKNSMKSEAFCFAISADQLKTQKVDGNKDRL